MQADNTMALKNFLKKSEIQKPPEFPLQSYKPRRGLKDFLITLGVNRSLKEKHQKPIEQFCQHLSKTKKAGTYKFKQVETPNNSKTKIFFKDQPIGSLKMVENQYEEHSANDIMKSTHPSTPINNDSLKKKVHPNKYSDHQNRSYEIGNNKQRMRRFSETSSRNQIYFSVPHKFNKKILGKNLKYNYRTVGQKNHQNTEKELTQIKDQQNQVDISVELPNEINQTESPANLIINYCPQCLNCGQPTEETILGVIQTATQMGIFGLQSDQNCNQNFTTFILNFTYIQHLIQFCPCKTCQCGQFRCPFNKQDASFLPIQSSAWNNLSLIGEEQYESLHTQYRLVSKSPTQYHTTNRNTFTTFTPRERQMKQKKHFQCLPFIGRSTYENNFINWRNHKDIEIFKRPLEEHVGRKNDIPINSTTIYSQNYKKLNLTGFENYQVSDIKNLQDQRQRSPFKNNYPDQYKTQYSASFQFQQDGYVSRISNKSENNQINSSPQRNSKIQKSLQFEIPPLANSLNQAQIQEKSGGNTTR